MVGLASTRLTRAAAHPDSHGTSLSPLVKSAGTIALVGTDPVEVLGMKHGEKSTWRGFDWYDYSMVETTGRLGVISVRDSLTKMSRTSKSADRFSFMVGAGSSFA
jgi:hypothetical protein